MNLGRSGRGKKPITRTACKFSPTHETSLIGGSSCFPQTNKVKMGHPSSLALRSDTKREDYMPAPIPETKAEEAKTGDAGQGQFPPLSGGKQ